MQPARRLHSAIPMLMPRLSVLLERAATGSGSNRSSGDTSISSLLSTLIPFFIIAAIILIVCLILQRYHDRIYAPRTYLEALSKNERTPREKAGFSGFLQTLRSLPDEHVLKSSSLDNYLFLRFFKMLTLMCFVGCLVTWPILFPVNATGGGGQSGLTILSFSNIDPGPRYLAHCFTAWIFLGFVMLLISRQTIYFVHLRQAYCLLPFTSSRISSRTVLFLDVPESYRDTEYLRHIFPNAMNVWFVKKTKTLEDMIEERDDAADKLEAGETKLIKSYVTNRTAKSKSESSEQGATAVESKDRPKHRTKPIIGAKVDTIDWSRKQLGQLISKVAEEQEKLLNDTSKTESAVFIEFDSVRAAETASQRVAHQDPLHMTATDIGMLPEEVIWKNLGKPWWLRKIINWACTVLVLVICVWWTIPVSFVGLITNVSYLTSQFSWLAWIDDIPSQIRGIITGLLPTVLLVLLMALVPIICQKLAGLFEPTQGLVQLRTQAWYFPFQVVQVFLITTFTSGAAAVGAQIAQNLTQAPQLLAKNLPKASNFYMAYFVYFGLLASAMQLLNLVPLLLFTLVGRFTDKTPRKMFNRYVQLGGLGWGSLYPKFTNLGVIALSYSSIAPLVLGFATIGLGLLYLAFRFNAFFTLGTNVSTRGRAYVRALQQLTVGIYLSELCLIGLFAIGTADSTLAVAALVLMVVFLVGTVVWHVQVRKALGKLTVSLPADLLAEEPVQARVDDEGLEKSEPGPTSAANTLHVHEAHAQSSEGGINNTIQTHGTREKESRLKRFMLPSKYSSAAAISAQILESHLSEPVRPYTERERQEAYLHPALTSECQRIWIPRDTHGLSDREIRDTKAEVGQSINVSNDCAWINERGDVEWDNSRLREVPIWEERPVY